MSRPAGYWTPWLVLLLLNIVACEPAKKAGEPCAGNDECESDLCGSCFDGRHVCMEGNVWGWRLAACGTITGGGSCVEWSSPSSPSEPPFQRYHCDDCENPQSCFDDFGESTSCSAGIYVGDAHCDAVVCYTSDGRCERDPAAAIPSSGTTSGAGAGCSVTQAQLEAKCMTPNVDVYDTCTFYCDTACVYDDGCQCGDSQSCLGRDVTCSDLERMGCPCSFCR